jgi:hypothetical protein
VYHVAFYLLSADLDGPRDESSNWRAHLMQYPISQAVETRIVMLLDIV